MSVCICELCEKSIDTDFDATGIWLGSNDFICGKCQETKLYEELYRGKNWKERIIKTQTDADKYISRLHRQELRIYDNALVMACGLLKREPEEFLNLARKEIEQ